MYRYLPRYSVPHANVRSGGLAPHVSPAASASLARIAAGPCSPDHTALERRGCSVGPMKSFWCDTNVTNRRGLSRTDRQAKIPKIPWLARGRRIKNGTARPLCPSLPLSLSKPISHVSTAISALSEEPLTTLLPPLRVRRVVDLTLDIISRHHTAFSDRCSSAKSSFQVGCILRLMSYPVRPSHPAPPPFSLSSHGNLQLLPCCHRIVHERDFLRIVK